MDAESDKEILYRSGITPDKLIHAAAEFMRAHPLQYRFSSNTLPPYETSFLDANGAFGTGEKEYRTSFNEDVTRVAAEYVLMVAGALTPYNASQLLGLSINEVHQRITKGSLYAVEGSGGQVFPRFQFFNRATLPSLESVVTAINDEAHPIAVQRFFLTPTADLQSKEVGRALSPREWLISGHSPEPVVLLAGEL